MPWLLTGKDCFWSLVTYSPTGIPRRKEQRRECDLTWMNFHPLTNESNRIRRVKKKKGKSWWQNFVKIGPRPPIVSFFLDKFTILYFFPFSISGGFLPLPFLSSSERAQRQRDKDKFPTFSFPWTSSTNHTLDTHLITKHTTLLGWLQKETDTTNRKVPLETKRTVQGPASGWTGSEVPFLLSHPFFISLISRFTKLF